MLSHVVIVAHDIVFFLKRRLTGTFTNTTNLASVLELEGTGRTLHAPDTGQNSSRDPDFIPTSVNGSPELGGPDLDGVSRPQRLTKTSHFVEQNEAADLTEPAGRFLRTNSTNVDDRDLGLTPHPQPGMDGQAGYSHLIQMTRTRLKREF